MFLTWERVVTIETSIAENLSRHFKNKRGHSPLELYNTHHSPNAMKSHMSYPVIYLFLALLSSFNVPAGNAGEIILPDIGESTGTLISPQQEKALGEAFFRSLQGRIEINQDAEIQQYIETIGSRLVASSDSPGIPFHFFVVLDNNINAFAGPGGYIGINSGLLLQTDSESELASVMAHEVAHVTQRHLYRSYEASSRLSIPTLAATLVAILIGTQSPELGQAALIALQAGSIQYQINFTRDNEQEADREGIQTLVKANYDPNGMPAFFEKLQQASRYYGQGIPEFLRTHPVTASRIADTRGRAEQYPYRHYPDSIAYQLIKTKLQVHASPNLNNTKKIFQKLQHQGTAQQRAVALYGSGLTDIKLQHFDAARTTFNRLIKLYPEQPHFAMARAHTAYQAKDYPRALALFKKASQIFPNNQPIKIEYLSASLKTGHPEMARDLLLPMLYEEQPNPYVYKLLAQAYGNLHQNAKSHRYLAEYFYATGQTRNAIIQAKLALKAKDLNFYLSAIMDQRLNFFILEEKASRLDL